MSRGGLKVVGIRPVTDTDTLVGEVCNRIRVMCNDLIMEHGVTHFTVQGILSTLVYEYIESSFEEEEYE